MINEENTINVKIVNAFTNGGEGGNPAGVVLDADHLSEDDMQKIATTAGLSETAFISRSDIAGFKLDFFTPNQRIAHCGHATVASFSYLAELERVQAGQTSKETVDGPRDILIDNGKAFMEQLAPEYIDSQRWEEKNVSLSQVLTSLGLATKDLDEEFLPSLVNTGNSFIVLAVKSKDILGSISPNFDVINQISNQLDLIGYYIFTTDVGDQNIDATTRMFAPRYGIQEEAATGMAAGPLACLLHDQLDMQKDHFLIEQGRLMTPKSPSLIEVNLKFEDNVITGLMAGGYGKVMKTLMVKYN